MCVSVCVFVRVSSADKFTLLSFLPIFFFAVTKCESGTKRCQRWYSQWNRDHCAPNMLCFGDRLCECVGGDTKNHISFEDFLALAAQSMFSVHFCNRCQRHRKMWSYSFNSHRCEDNRGKNHRISNKTHTFYECDLTSSCAARTSKLNTIEETVTCVYVVNFGE